MADDDFYKIEFARNEKLDKFLKELDLKEGNMYIILKPEDEGFEIVGADLLPSDLDTCIFCLLVLCKWLQQNS